VRYDVVGDVHGQIGKLRALLVKMGYRETGGAFRRTGHTAVFVGDLIDRGPGQLETVELVRRMVDAGTAKVVMGNHELNAIAWVTPNPDRPGSFLREHTSAKRRQHEAFLEAAAGKPIHAEIIAWFRTLPLFLDLGKIRVVHAWWHAPYIERLRPLLGHGDVLSEELLVSAHRAGSGDFAAVQGMLKGLEIDLPAGFEFRDKDGATRREIRARWWDAKPRTYRQAAIMPDEHMASIPDHPLPAGIPLGSADSSAVPVFIGHYWLTGTPKPLAPSVICVDYSAGNGGPLCAYRWDGEPSASADNMIVVE
jgi:Calcineurin-like phosphoesterase